MVKALVLRVSEPTDQRFGADDHPLTGEFSRRYYPEVFGESRRDASFSVFNGESPVAFVPMNLSTEVADYFGFPIRVFVKDDERAVTNFAIDYALGLAKGRAIKFLDTDGKVAEACERAGLKSVSYRVAVSDLSLSPAKRHSAIRHSYRSLVNWGRANIAMTYLNGSNPDREAFDKFQAFHFSVAGRSTRPQSSWDAMFDWIASGNGELSLGYIDGEIVTGTMIVDGNKHSYYASGVNDRKRFDKPMSHFAIADAIERAALRGKSVFEIGEVPAEGEASEKEVNIGKFKSGFATSILVPKIWRTP